MQTERANKAGQDRRAKSVAITATERQAVNFRLFVMSSAFLLSLLLLLGAGRLIGP